MSHNVPDPEQVEMVWPYVNPITTSTPTVHRFRQVKSSLKRFHYTCPLCGKVGPTYYEVGGVACSTRKQAKDALHFHLKDKHKVSLADAQRRVRHNLPASED